MERYVGWIQKKQAWNSETHDLILAALIYLPGACFLL